MKGRVQTRDSGKMIAHKNVQFTVMSIRTDTVHVIYLTEYAAEDVKTPTMDHSAWVTAAFNVITDCARTPRTTV